MNNQLFDNSEKKKDLGTASLMQAPSWKLILVIGFTAIFISGVISTMVSLFLYPYLMTAIITHHSMTSLSVDEAGTRQPPLPPPNFSTDEKISYDWSLRDIDGKRIEVASFKGKPIFLNFWATWCQPCLQEMKSIEKLHEKFKDEIIFLCVADDQVETLKKFIEKHHYNLPLYTLYSDPPDVFSSHEFPTTYIFDSSGHLILKHAGGRRLEPSSEHQLFC